eukprot:scaffold1396_cov252-Pinguiococcus_pyrenoidosus.AAC.31
MEQDRKGALALNLAAAMSELDTSPPQQPLVQCDVQQDLVFQDAVQSLKALAGLVDSVLEVISSKVESERRRIEQVNHRMQSCEETIARISGSNRAITVYSLPKHPNAFSASGGLVTFEALLQKHVSLPEAAGLPVADAEAVCVLEAEGHPLPFSPNSDTLGDAVERDDFIALEELYQKLHVWHSDPVREAIIMEDKGLRPPAHRTVTDMLLFNSNVLPYNRQLRAVDNLGGEDEQEDVETPQGIADRIAVAPTTLIDGDILPEVMGLDISYKPAEAEAMDLNLPSNLPLPDLADISFLSNAASIAPSASLLPDLGDVGDIDKFRREREASPAETKREELPEKLDVKPPKAQEVEAAPSPAPESQASTTPEKKKDGRVSRTPPGKGHRTSSSLPAIPSSRSNLLAAIQVFRHPVVETARTRWCMASFAWLMCESHSSSQIKASNMETLRSVEERQLAEPSTAEGKAAGEGLSLMDALRERMKRRQNAISGKR